MLNLTRKVPRKGKSFSTYGDRNKVLITTEDGTEVEIELKNLKGNEVQIGIHGPLNIKIQRMEEITGAKGSEYDQRKKERDNLL